MSVIFQIFMTGLLKLAFVVSTSPIALIMIRYFSLLLLLGSFFTGRGQSDMTVVKGKLDLRHWNMSDDPVIWLDGEWLFFHNELIQWNEIKQRKHVVYAQFSRPWNEQVIDGKELPGEGYATYAMEVLLPHDHDSLAVDVPAVFNSNALWVNDTLISTNGKVGTSAAEMEPMWKPQTVRINAGDTLRIVFQIANFQSSRGGSAVSIHLGSAKKLFASDAVSRVSLYVLIAFFGLVGLVSLVVFALSGRTPLVYFSGLSLAFALRFMFSDLYPYYDFGLTLSWVIAAKIEYASVPIIVIWGTLFISSIYPLEFKRPVKIFFLVVNFALVLFVFFTSPSAFAKLLTVIQMVALAFLVYAVYCITKAVIYERVGAWATAIGVAIFALVGIYNLFTFLFVIELNRIVILVGYSLALVLNAVSLWYRTSVRLKEENQSMLRYSDLYSKKDA